MANQNKQLTVADLEAAKKYCKGCARTAKALYEKDLWKLERISATCIGIVEEMVKLEDCDCIIDRHNALNSIYNRAVAAFGGEVK